MIFLPVILYFNYPYLSFSQKEMIKRSVEENAYFSSRIIDWFTPNPESLLYGELVKGVDYLRQPPIKGVQIPYNELSLALLITPFILFILGFIYLKNLKDRYQLGFVITFLGITFIFIFGPFFMGFAGHQPIFPLPFRLLFEIFPWLQGIRVPSRMQFFFYLPFALVVGYGVLKLFKRYPKYPFLITLAIIGALFIENINTFPYDSTSQALSSHTSYQKNNFLKDKLTLHFPYHPPDIGEEAVYLNLATLTGEKLFNGVNSYTPADHTQLLKGMENKVTDENLKKIKALGIDYLVIHKSGENLADVEIVDIKNQDLDVKICDFNRSFDIQLTTLSIGNQQTPYNALVLTNKTDCYLVNQFSNRYKEINIGANIAKVRLPILIEPKQQVILSEIYSTLRID